MARHLDDLDKLRRFVSVVNEPEPSDPSFAYVVERGQPRPATPAERVPAEGAGDAVVIAGPRLEVATR